jgi:hypothetical protein
MTTELDAIYINNSQLFRASVYDLDGVTPLTPLSCKCSIWNKDTNTQVINEEDGTVGAGYAQFNWSGHATAARYEAVLTVTISAGVVKSEHFLVEVRAKPPALTLAPDENIGKLRRMTNEKTNTTYTDEEMTAYIEACPTTDENGEPPRVPSTTTPGEMMVNSDWTATYDLHAAAAMIWEEKAAIATPNVDFEADGASYSDSQTFEQAMKMVRFHLARRNPSTITLVPNLARERTNETN